MDDVRWMMSGEISPCAVLSRDDRRTKKGLRGGGSDELDCGDVDNVNSKGTDFAIASSRNHGLARCLIRCLISLARDYAARWSLVLILVLRAGIVRILRVLNLSRIARCDTLDNLAVAIVTGDVDRC